MAGIERLPATIRLQICRALTDLKALDALTRVSPAFAATFFFDCADILEHVMGRTLHKSIIVLIRADIILQTDTYTSQRFEDLLSKAGEVLPRAISTRAATSTLRAFTEVHNLGVLILTSKLQYLLTLKYERLLDDDFTYKGHVLRNENPSATTSFKVDTLSRPSWVEEQRITRALLRVKLYCAILFGRKESINTSIKLYADLSPDMRSTANSFQASLRPWEQDELDEALCSSNAILSNDKYKCNSVEFGHLAHPGSSLVHYWVSPAALPPTTKLTSIRRQVYAAVEGVAIGWLYFFKFWKVMKFSPMEDADWMILRPLGLGFWDEEKMAEQLKLIMISDFVRQHCGIQARSLWRDDEMFTWHQLYLSEEEKITEEAGKI